MIDFNNSVFVKLKQCDVRHFSSMIQPFFAAGEEALLSFVGIRDGVVFTNKRILAINVQGLTGAKKDFTSLPYAKIQAFSVESAGTLDRDSELELWFSGMGKVKFEFSRGTDIVPIGRLISQFTL